MIFEQSRADKQVMLTISLGDKALMDVIQAAPSDAVQDLNSVQTQLQPQIKDAAKPPASKPADSERQPTMPTTAVPSNSKPATTEQKPNVPPMSSAAPATATAPGKK